MNFVMKVVGAVMWVAGLLLAGATAMVGQLYLSIVGFLIFWWGTLILKKYSNNPVDKRFYNINSNTNRRWR